MQETEHKMLSKLEYREVLLNRYMSNSMIFHVHGYELYRAGWSIKKYVEELQKRVESKIVYFYYQDYDIWVILL